LEMYFALMLRDILSCFVNISKPVQQEVSRTVILPLSYRDSQCSLIIVTR